MSELIAVKGDLVVEDSGGALHADVQSKVYVEGKLVVVEGDIADPVNDDDDPEADPREFSSKVFIGGNGIHRDGGRRQNNYTTRVVGNTKVFAG